MKTLKIKNSLWVHYEGKIFRLEKKSSATSSAETATMELEAPFTCKVLKVHVSPEAKIKEGDPVVTVEAMKMEFSYASPRTGTVKEVLVKETQVIHSGQKFILWKEP